MRRAVCSWSGVGLCAKAHRNNSSTFSASLRLSFGLAEGVRPAAAAAQFTLHFIGIQQVQRLREIGVVDPLALTGVVRCGRPNTSRKYDVNPSSPAT